MSRTMSKEELVKEFGFSDKMGQFTDLTELESQMKRYVVENDIHIRGNYLENDLQGSTDYTMSILNADPALYRKFNAAMQQNRKRRGMDVTDLNDFVAGRGKRKNSSWGNTNTAGNRGSRGSHGSRDSRGSSNWEDQGYWKGMATFYGDKIRGGGRDRRSHRHQKSLKEILFSPLGVVLAVIAVCIFLYEVVGPAMYSFIMNGPFFKILLIILAGAAVVAILKSARGWPSGVKFVVILVIGLVLLYSIVGPAIYSFLMSGALFKILCLLIGAAAVVGILKADMGWPIGVKLVVIVVIWLVLKSEVL